MANTTKKLTPDGDDMPDVQTLAQAAGGDVVTCPDRLNIYVQGESYTVFAGSTLAVRYKGGAVWLCIWNETYEGEPNLMIRL